MEIDVSEKRISPKETQCNPKLHELRLFDNHQL